MFCVVRVRFLIQVFTGNNSSLAQAFWYLVPSVAMLIMMSRRLEIDMARRHRKRRRRGVEGEYDDEDDDDEGDDDELRDGELDDLDGFWGEPEDPDQRRRGGRHAGGRAGQRASSSFSSFTSLSGHQELNAPLLGSQPDEVMTLDLLTSPSAARIPRPRHLPTPLPASGFPRPRRRCISILDTC